MTVAPRNRKRDPRTKSATPGEPTPRPPGAIILIPIEA